MLDVERLVREGKSVEDIQKSLREQIAAYKKKIEQEKEEELILQIKEDGIRQKREIAEKALQEYYDAIDQKPISVILRNGKIRISDYRTLRGKRSKLATMG